MDYTAYGESVGTGTGLRTAAQGFGVSDTLRQRYALTERDDATGLDHTWFRKHENQAGRWTSPDPYNGSMNLGDPQSFNRYSYVENEPTNYIDPSGLQMVAQRTCRNVFRMAYVDGEFDSAWWEEVCTTEYVWVDDAAIGIGGAGGNPISAQEVEMNLDSCLRTMYNLRVTSFTPSQKGKHGNVNVNSTDGRRFGPAAGFGFGVVNDATSFNSVQIGTIGGGGTDDGVTALGFAPSPDGQGFQQYSPHINYTANNLTNPTYIMAVQIHELGHSLTMITGIQPKIPSKARRPGGPDGGTPLERCVFGGEVGRNGRIYK
jgi:RHS repeat-associated protein